MCILKPASFCVYLYISWLSLVGILSDWKCSVNKILHPKNFNLIEKSNTVFAFQYAIILQYISQLMTKFTSSQTMVRFTVCLCDFNMTDWCHYASWWNIVKLDEFFLCITQSFHLSDKFKEWEIIKWRVNRDKPSNGSLQPWKYVLLIKHKYIE